MFDVEVDHADASDRLESAADRVESRALLSMVGEELTDWETELFATSGRGQWRPLHPRTIALKGSARILVDSGTLMRALTSRAEISGDTVSLSAPSYAKYQQASGRDPVLAPPGSMTSAWARLLGRYIVDGQR